MKSVVSEKGQITVPKPIRDRLGIATGTELDMEIVPGGFVARKRMRRSAWRDLVGILRHSDSSDRVVEQMRGRPDALKR